MTSDGARSATALTPREMEVLTLLAAGSSNREIAVRLTVCEDTVKYHLKRIYRVLGVLRRTQAVLAAQQAGLLAGSWRRCRLPGQRHALTIGSRA